MQRILFPIIVATLFVVFNSASGQDPFSDTPAGGDPFSVGGGNPFGTEGSPFGGPPTAGNEQGGSGETFQPEDPLVKELQRYAAGNNQQLAVAIQSAIQISEWKEATAFLDILAARNPSDTDSAVIVGGIKPHYLIRLLQHESLSDAQRDLIQKLLVNAKKYSEDRARIRGEISKLDSPSDGVRSNAVANIRTGGEASVAELVAAYVSPDPPVKRDLLYDVLRRYGDDARKAFEQFALYGEAEVRPHALEGLTRLNNQSALPDLVAAFHGKDSSNAERSVAANGLKRVLRGLPSRREAEVYLSNILQKTSDYAARTPRSETNVRIWQIAQDKKAIDWTNSPRHIVLSRIAADAAYRLNRLGFASMNATTDAVLADLGYRMLVNPLYGSQADYEARFGKAGASQSDLALLKATLSTAIDRENEYAAVAAIRLLKQTKDPSLIASDGPTQTLLVRAASHATPQVRFEAADAIGTIDHDFSFPGSSELLHRWIEMSRLDFQPTVLILDSHVHRTVDKISWLQSLGYRVEILQSVADLLRRLNSGGDISFLLADSQPFDRPIVEAVDLVRRHQHGGSIPILIYCQPARTLWDEDLTEPVLSRAGFAIVNDDPDVVKNAQENRTFEHPVLSEAMPKADFNFESAQIRARHGVLEERNRISTSIGNRWTAPLAVVEAIISPQRLARLLDDLSRKMPMPPMTATDREAYAQKGITALGRIADSKNSTYIYDLLSHETEVAEAVARGGFSKEGLALLSGFGTPESQTRLTNLASNSTLPESVRQHAAEAFADSVGRSGTRLDRESIALQYQRYNAAADEAERAVLGIILDAMEIRVGAKAPKS